MLEKGFHPYKDNDLSLLDEEIIEVKKENTKPIIEKPLEILTPTNPTPIAIKVEPIVEEPTMTIKEAFEFALKIKKGSLNDTSYKNFEGRINRFKKWLNEKFPITSITRKLTNEYLNEVLENSSARNGLPLQFFLKIYY